MTTAGMSVIGKIYSYVFMFSYNVAFCYLLEFVKVLVRNIPLIWIIHEVNPWIP
jgi:hypothetical protein